MVSSPVKCWTEVVRVDIHVLALILERKHSLSTLKHDKTYRFVTDIHCQAKKIVNLFWEFKIILLKNLQWMLEFLKCLWCNHWVNYPVLSSSFVNMLNYILTCISLSNSGYDILSFDIFKVTWLKCSLECFMYMFINYTDL